jgi:hypothetical protein
MVRRAMAGLPGAKVIWLSGYFSPPWADAVADRGADIETALLNVIAQNQSHKHEGIPADLTGAVAGITYNLQGDGPPLVLLPLSLASSQWEPLLGRLAARCRTLTLGGPELGFLAMLESRGRSAGYLNVIRHVIDSVQLRAGEVVLEVGCGSGVLDRWLARYTRQTNRSLVSTSTDIFSARRRL